MSSPPQLNGAPAEPPRSSNSPCATPPPYGNRSRPAPPPRNKGPSLSSPAPVEKQMSPTARRNYAARTFGSCRYPNAEHHTSSPCVEHQSPLESSPCIITRGTPTAGNGARPTSPPQLKGASASRRRSNNSSRDASFSCRNGVGAALRNVSISCSNEEIALAAHRRHKGKCPLRTAARKSHLTVVALARCSRLTLFLLAHWRAPRLRQKSITPAQHLCHAEKASGSHSCCNVVKALAPCRRP